MEHDIPAALNRSPWYPLVLAAIFIACFSLSVFLGVRFGMRFVDSSGASSSDVETELVPKIADIDADQNYVHIRNSENLIPQTGRDFLLTVWVKFKKLPAPGQRVVFLGKTDWDDPRHSGFSMSLTREANVFRPAVYWQPPTGGNVGTLVFSELRVVPQRWILFALSVKDNRFLGLHTAMLLDGSAADVRLAGGFDVQNAAPPEGKTDLLVGALGSSPFRGEIGPIGVFEPKEIRGEVKRLLKDLVKNPAIPPEDIDQGDIRLWAANPNDLEFASRVEIVKPSMNNHDAP
jgi:hypothetical protein